MSETVHIWRAALDEEGWAGPERLPAAERERAAAIVREEAGRRWVAARWALRRVLASCLDEPAAAIELERGEHGKPRLAAGGPEFSLSHSNGLALVAVCEDCAVGVDVELVEPRENLAALAERALPAEDAKTVQAAAEADRCAAFYAAWTRHEARFKCLGDPSLRSSTYEVQDRKLAAAAVENIDVAPGYAAAVAVAGSEIGPLDCHSLRAG